jgi:indolepyruvate ferredoxin oxidoreductase beta subunit
MQSFNIFLIGVGGQGIGLLSETIMKAIDMAGYKVKGVDTHGLAQRGGTVSSHIRMGEHVFSPLNRIKNVDLTIALERHEALRAINLFARQDSTLVYYDAVWQPLNVRLRKEKQIEMSQISDTCQQKHIKEYRIFVENLIDSRMQNVALLACISKYNLIPGISKEHYINALSDIMQENVLNKNLELFENLINKSI